MINEVFTSAPTTAELFWSGRSQAVRLPEEFRFEGGTVAIRRAGNAAVLEPVTSAKGEWAWLDAFNEPLDEDFVKAVLEEVPQQQSPALDDM